MARIQLHRSFNLTAPTSFTNPKMGPSERWLDFDGGYRMAMTPHGDDTARDLYLTHRGGRVFSMSNFRVSIHPSDPIVEQLFEEGNFLPLWTKILAGSDHVTGSAGRDVVDGLTGNDTIQGLGGHDVLRGGAGKDLLEGGTGNDRLIAGTGADIVKGDSGLDTLEFQTSAKVTVDLTVAKAQAFHGGSVTVSGVENLRGGSGDDRLSGDARANVLEGGAGKDTLLGRAGNDRLLGGNGNDLLDGGAGNDVLLGEIGADTLRGGAGSDKLDGGTGNDLMTGGLGADRFTFRLGSGHDRINDFTQGEDRIVFEAGTEVHVIDRGADTVIKYGADSITLVNVDYRLIDEADFVFT